MVLPSETMKSAVLVGKTLAPYFCEFYGTCMFLITISCSTTTAMYMNDDNYYTRAPTQQPFAPLAIGVALMCLTYAGGHISGGHYNPAVSLAVFLSGRNKMSLIQLAGYTVCQFLGGILGAGIGFGIMDENGAPDFKKDTGGYLFGAEFVYTLGLCLIFLQVGTSKKTENNGYFGLAIGLFVFAGAASVGMISGGFFNPAVTGGMFSIANSQDNDNENWYIYYLAQYLAAVFAAVFYVIMNIGSEYELDPIPPPQESTENPVQQVQAIQTPDQPNPQA